MDYWTAIHVLLEIPCYTAAYFINCHIFTLSLPTNGIISQAEHVLWNCYLFTLSLPTNGIISQAEHVL